MEQLTNPIELGGWPPKLSESRRLMGGTLSEISQASEVNPEHTEEESSIQVF